MYLSPLVTQLLPLVKETPVASMALAEVIVAIIEQLPMSVIELVLPLFARSSIFVAADGWVVFQEIFPQKAPVCPVSLTWEVKALDTVAAEAKFAENAKPKTTSAKPANIEAVFLSFLFFVFKIIIFLKL